MAYGLPYILGSGIKLLFIIVAWMVITGAMMLTFNATRFRMPQEPYTHHFTEPPYTGIILVSAGIVVTVLSILISIPKRDSPEKIGSPF